MPLVVTGATAKQKQVIARALATFTAHPSIPARLSTLPVTVKVGNVPGGFWADTRVAQVAGVTQAATIRIEGAHLARPLLLHEISHCCQAILPPGRKAAWVAWFYATKPRIASPSTRQDNDPGELMAEALVAYVAPGTKGYGRLSAAVEASVKTLLLPSATPTVAEGQAVRSADPSACPSG